MKRMSVYMKNSFSKKTATVAENIVNAMNTGRRLSLEEMRREFHSLNPQNLMNRLTQDKVSIKRNFVTNPQTGNKELIFYID